MARKRKTKGRRSAERDPTMSPWAEDIGLPGLIEYGGELIYAVDFTPGGTPIGLAVRSLEAYLSGDFAMEEDDELGDIDEQISVDEDDQPYQPGRGLPSIPDDNPVS